MRMLDRLELSDGEGEESILYFDEKMKTVVLKSSINQILNCLIKAFIINLP